VIDLADIYRQLARTWTHEELAVRYKAASDRGARDLEPTHVSERPIGLLATAVPRLISLSVATYALHVLPTSPSQESATIVDELQSTIDIAAAAGLHRCHLALELDARRHGYTVEEWLPVPYEVAASELKDAGLDREPPSVVEHAQQAGRWTAIAIDSLDQDAAGVPDAIEDALGRPLVVSLFADTARGHLAMFGRVDASKLMRLIGASRGQVQSSRSR
jgi:hypothetical protein